MTFERIKELIVEIQKDGRYVDDYLLNQLFDQEFNTTKYPHKNWEEIGPMIRCEIFDISEYFNDPSEDIGYLQYKAYVVYYFSAHDIYIKFSGWVGSYVSFEFEDMKQVAPIQKTITVYE